MAFGRTYEDLDRDAKAYTGAVWVARVIEVLIQAHTRSS
jgi:hypothetical protein